MQQRHIEVLFNDLDLVIDSLQNVLLSGRAVKVGIVIFNVPGNSQIASQLTSDLQHIRRVLKDLLDRYHQDVKSIDPGESSYLGIRKAKDLNWQSQNRQVIVITDEPSHLLSTGQHTEVQTIQDEMKEEFNIYPIIVRLCN